MRKHSRLFFVVTLVIFIILSAGCGQKQQTAPSAKKEITITDSTGREMTVQAGLNRLVVLNTNAAEALRILQVPDDVIIGVSDTMQKVSYLSLEKKPSVGKWNTPNYEKIIELKPQAVIAYVKTPDKSIEDKLEPAGIKVIRLDLSKPETYTSDLKTLAKVFEKDKAAEEFAKWMSEKSSLVEDRLKDLKTDNKYKVFCLWGDYNLTMGSWGTWNQKTGAHQLIEMAGGINVARDLKEDYPKVSQEWVLEKNPDIVILPTFEEKGVLGYEVEDYTNAAKSRDIVLNNPVTEKTNAGKNKKVYVMSAKIQQSCMTTLGTIYLAKWLYPESFKDINPDQILKEYFEKWLRVPFKGKWAYPES